MENNKVIVINLMGCPGSGKSTAASGIFYRLKKMGGCLSVDKIIIKNNHK